MDNTAASAEAEPVGGEIIRRHGIFTRLWHWINAAMIIILLMSGLMIFNAHPRLYWGSYGANPDPAWLQIGSVEEKGYLWIGETQIETTSVLGAWKDAKGETVHLAFPPWATLPSAYNLAEARRWHISAAWVFAIGMIAYLAVTTISGRFWRGLVPSRQECAPGQLWKSAREHAMLRFPCGAEACRYNALQKLSYLFVLVILLPSIILTGLAMSPQMAAAWPWLLDVWGGRQSARSVHFIAASLLVLFTFVHLGMVIAAGPWNTMRSMITGKFRVPMERKP